MNVLSNGQVVCLSTHSDELLAIQAYNNGTNDVTDVIVYVTIPEGVTVSSSTPSQGTFEETEEPGFWIWTIGTLTSSQNESSPETLEICVTINDDSLSPFVFNYEITCNECPDDSPEDNSGSRTIDGLRCSDFSSCLNSLFACLIEFDSMAEAIAEIGNGKPFLASIENTEGWSYRALLVTPHELTLVCPSNVVDYICLGGNLGVEYVYEDENPILELQVTSSCCTGTSYEVVVESFLDEEATLPCTPPGGEGDGIDPPYCSSNGCDEVYYEKYTVTDACGLTESCIRSIILACC